MTETFLDDVVGQILHFEHQQALNCILVITPALNASAQNSLAQQDAQYQKQQKEIAHLTAFVDRFRAKATKAKQAQSRLKRLQKLPELAPAHVDSQFSFSFPKPDHLPYPLLSLTEANCGYPSVTILEQVGITLVPGSRIGLLGRNGAGKSTLIKSLAGELALKQGQRYCAQELNIGYFSQHQLEQLHPESSGVDHILATHKEMTELQARSHLGSFGFSGDQALSPAKNMSGGEKARLVLALIVLTKPQLLLLDEPTNHLDLEMRQALVLALQDFAGAIILIAHDRYLLESCVDEFYLVANGKADEFSGDIDDYQQWLLTEQKSAKQEQQGDNVSNSAEPVVDRKQQRREQAELRKKAAPLKKQADKLETTLDKWQQQLADIEQALGDSDLYQAENKVKLTDYLKQQAKLKADIDESEMQWLDLLEQIEQITGAG